MPKRNAVTAYGDVEYNTVECSSCGNEVPKQQAKRWVMGKVEKCRNYHRLGHEQYNFKCRGIVKGWACEYCQNSPAKVPQPDRLVKSLSNEAIFKIALILTVFNSVLWVVL